ncbi:MAG: alpha-glucosidase C-terminal domain-containing protein [Chloroflexi bacterium]|nr:alpha-glucosidase C-terminal domain-containing protein [Chloroflexota bacterium]
MRATTLGFFVSILALALACSPVPAPTPPATPISQATSTILPTPTFIPYTTPAWFREAMLYEIFVRSFSDSDGDGIGDLDGITSRLDYLESLGVNAIWLMPISPSPSAHGYDVIDYFAVNPDYGTLEDLQELVAAAHARRMWIILDFVPSHLSDEHPFFRDAFRNPSSEYSDWFVWTNEAHTLYASFAGIEDMPRFNHFNPEVVEYLVQAALFWLDLDGDGNYSDGVDGFRIDNATFPPQEFFSTLRQRVKAVDPEAVLLGETWVHNPADLARFFPDQFDALFDFPLSELLQGDQNFNGDGLLSGKKRSGLLTVLLEEEGKRFPEEAIALRFMSNHDTNRIASEVAGDVVRERLAAALLATLPGPVMLYYGEEIGMLGQKGGPPHWDNYRREPMDWYADQEGPGQTTWFRPEDRWNQPDDGISVEEEETDPESLLNFYRYALALRRSRPALSRGEIVILELEVSGAGPWGFIRSVDGETLVAIFNFADENREVTIATFPFSAASLIDLFTGEVYPAAEVDEPYPLTLPAAAAVLLGVSK